VELSEEDREAEAARKYEKKLRKAADLALEYDGKTDVSLTPSDWTGRSSGIVMLYRISTYEYAHLVLTGSQGCAMVTDKVVLWFC